MTKFGTFKNVGFHRRFWIGLAVSTNFGHAVGLHVKPVLLGIFSRIPGSSGKTMRFQPLMVTPQY
jgi:hypothetical protein